MLYPIQIYIYKKCTFPNPAPEGRTETLLVTYIPQMLATNIQYKYIYIKKITFPDPTPEGRTETLLVTYIPRMLAANIQYKKCTLGLTETLQVMYIP